MSARDETPDGGVSVPSIIRPGAMARVAGAIGSLVRTRLPRAADPRIDPGRAEHLSAHRRPAPMLSAPMAGVVHRHLVLRLDTIDDIANAARRGELDVIHRR